MMKQLFLMLLISSAQIVLHAETEREKESEKGVAGAVNQTADIILGTSCLIGAWLLYPTAQQSLTYAHQQSNGLGWFAKKETWFGFFDGKLDNDEKRIGGAYFQAIGWASATIALGGIGLKKVCRGIGLIK